MTNPLLGLVPVPSGGPPWLIRDGKITSVTPLEVLLQGDEEEPVPPTKKPLVGGIAVGDKVCCLLADRQLIILGRYGG